MSTSHRVAARFVAATKLDGLQIEYRVERHGDQVIIRLIVLNRADWYKEHGYSRGLPAEMRRPDYVDGELVLKRISSAETRDRCLPNVRVLQAQHGSLDVWVVHSVLLRNQKLEARGLGKEMYLKGFAAISPAIVTSDHCGGGQTSFYAKRVWESLKSGFPHSGSGDEIALAV